MGFRAGTGGGWAARRIRQLRIGARGVDGHTTIKGSFVYRVAGGQYGWRRSCQRDGAGIFGPQRARSGGSLERFLALAAFH
jgi:hypothetical protein